MRRRTPLAPLGAQSWVPLGTAGLRLQVLNEDPDSGARTAILVSPPRPDVQHKAQFHASEEEFYCLGGRFTFDGEHWFEPDSYACFPAGVVHGAHVHVPEGYRLYLRTSGSTAATPIPQPRRLTPYRADDRDDAPQVTLLPADGAAAVRVLRADGSRAVERWRLRAGMALPVEGWRAAPLELLLVSGTLVVGREAVAGPAYGFYPDADEVPRLTVLDEAVVLVHLGDWP